MEVIKSGKLVKYTICHECEAVLSYLPRDVDHRYQDGHSIEVIICPECLSEIITNKFKK